MPSERARVRLNFTVRELEIDGPVTVVKTTIWRPEWAEVERRQSEAASRTAPPSADAHRDGTPACRSCPSARAIVVARSAAIESVIFIEI